MYLNQLIKSLGKKYRKIKCSGISFDSRNIKKNEVFFAFKGSKTSGEKYIKEAENKKAVAIISDQKIEKKNLKIPTIYVKNARLCLSEACSNFYKMKPKNMIAVTGTNGKTSVANFFYQILNLNKIKAASIGTLGVNSKKYNKKTSLTSMDSISLHKCLETLAKKKINDVIMEASSHGLDQKRLDYIKFKTGIFTNLSHDHLDYHKNMKNYLNSKLHLFKSILLKKTCVITDEKNKEFKMIKKITQHKQMKLKTINSGKGLKILKHYYYEKNQFLKILYNSKIYEFEIPLIGYLQCKNLLMSILAALSVGIKISNILKITKRLKPVKGRLEYLGSQRNNSKIILDYAHTPDALEQTLKCIKEHFKKDIIIVFGCGGDRDFKKRSIMGNIAKKYCRKIFVTDDNPRYENPKKIRSMIIKSCGKFYSEIPNRKKAIEKAVKDLKPYEILLVAGKGHEKYQDYGNYQIKISDKEIIKKSIKKNKKFLRNYNWKFDIIKNALSDHKIKKFKYSKVLINSKESQKNSLFVAIKGKNNDGHNFVKEVLKKGATKVIISKKIKNINNNKVIKVSNTLQALTKISRVARTFSNIKTIAITGSSGKTTLKTLLSLALSKYGNVHSSPSSFNNKYGVPFSLSNIKENSKFGVFEIGMSKKGEIDKLSKIVRPDIGVITNIAEAHIENFNNIKDIAKAKSEILNNISYKGYIILNHDDYFYDYLLNKAKLNNLKILSFSMKKKSDVYLKKITKLQKNYKLVVNIQNKNYEFYTNSIYKNFIQNFLSVILVLYSMNLDLHLIKKTFTKFNTPSGRGDVSNIFIYGKNIKLIDESYNANPLSMKSAINNFNSYKQINGNQKILILGDMLELGKESIKHHKLLSNEINKSSINKVYVYGNYIKQTFYNLKTHKKGKIIEKLDNLKKIFKDNIKNKDIIMIKASNATGLFQVSQNLKKGRINAI